jgi:hypothetical protein
LAEITAVGAFALNEWSGVVEDFVDEIAKFAIEIIANGIAVEWGTIEFQVGKESGGHNILYHI